MFACLALVAGFGAAPADAQFKPSKADQVKLGRQAAQDVRKKERVLGSYDARVRVMRDVANRLLATVDTRNEPWEFSFDVIENKEVNAFAFPGGPVFFYTGLLDKIKTEDQLAGVLAHEMTHVRREHWATQYNDSQKRNLLLSLGLIIFKANNTIGNLTSVVNSLYSLKYSRKHETESDDRGLDMMVQAGYSPEGMADVFRILAQSGGGKPPEFLSSHPSDSSRIKRIQDKAKGMQGSGMAQKPVPWAK